MALPVPTLDDTTFEELVEEARKLIPLYAPEWTDHNLHDPGMTLIDLFAWLVEMQLYRLDQVTEQHRMKYLKLLGIRPKPALPARVDVQVLCETSQAIPSGTALDVPSASPVLRFETEEQVTIWPVTIAALVSYAGYQWTDVTGFNDAPNVYFYAFGEDPAPGDALYLGLRVPAAAAGQRARFGVYLFENDLPPVGRHGDESARVFPSAEVAWEYFAMNPSSSEADSPGSWLPLEIRVTKPRIRIFSQRGILRMTFPLALERHPFPYASEQLNFAESFFWIRCRIVRAAYELAPRIDRILPNIMSATQGVTIDSEPLGPGSGLPYQEYLTQHAPVVPKSAHMTINGAFWREVSDLDASQPEDMHYTLDLATGTVRFGDGIRGAVPPQNAAIHLTYRYGGGACGNIDANCLTEIALPDVRVSNPVPASGGTEAEELDQAFMRVRQDLLVPYTAVTARDYETITRDTPGVRIARAKAVIASGRENEVTVVVVPFSFSEKPLPSAGLKKTVCEHLDRHRLLTTRLIIREPDYVGVSVQAEVSILAGEQPDQVRELILRHLNAFFSPIQRKPGDHAWPFGRPVYRSEVYELLEGVAGVDCVRRLSLRAENGVFTYKRGDIVLGELSLVYAGEHSVSVLEPQTLCAAGGRYE